ncbi:MAG: hypothetical protein CMJ78_12300 [Planctomycetaceae bacterium]|nr:hypothetical protein [Planctomycetaceae bacterium]
MMATKLQINRRIFFPSKLVLAKAEVLLGQLVDPALVTEHDGDGKLPTLWPLACELNHRLTPNARGIPLLKTESCCR